MGMSINEAIRRIDEHNYIHQRKEPRAVYITEAFNTLIEVAKKYQKIEQLIKFYNNAGEIPIFVLEGIMKDGNDN